MTDILKIAANSQAYLFVQRDTAQDKFDVKKFVFNYGNALAFPGPWAFWKMEEASGTRADSTGNGRHLSVETPANDPGNDTGILGNCVEFPAYSYDDYVLQHAGELNLDAPQQWTVTFWFKASDIDPASWGDVLVELNFCQVSIDIYPLDDGTTDFDVGLPGTDVDEIFTLDTTNWHFVCVYYNGVGVYLEVDNVEKGSRVGGSGLTAGAGDVRITGSDDIEGMLGYVDEVGVWLEALSSDQRTQLYNGGAGWSPY